SIGASHRRASRIRAAREHSPEGSRRRTAAGAAYTLVGRWEASQPAGIPARPEPAFRAPRLGTTAAPAPPLRSPVDLFGPRPPPRGPHPSRGPTPPGPG